MTLQTQPALEPAADTTSPAAIKPMRIVHLSTSDAAGGAARAAFRLHNGLRRLGHNSKMLVSVKYTYDADVNKSIPRHDLVAKVRRRIRKQRITADFAPYKGKLPVRAEMFSDDRAVEPGYDIAAQMPECDIINVHWVSGFLDHEGFFGDLAKHRLNVPIVWRLADMGALTGGCHYDQGCGKFTAKCGACPELGSSVEHDLSRDVWTRKDHSLRMLDDGRVHLVATSRWIAAEAKRSSLLGRFPVTIIPNGLDISVFRPRDRAACRDLFDIPADAKVVLFVADSVAHRRKGFAELTEAVAGISGIENLLLISIGGGKPALSGGQRHLHLGRLSDDRLLSMAYSAADAFVIPSLQESFGQTVTESMACGTPVIGFASGGIPDMVRPGETGWLAETGDTAALRDRIIEALSDDATRKLRGETARRVVEAEYSLEVQARRYSRLYETLIAARARGRN